MLNVFDAGCTDGNIIAREVGIIINTVVWNDYPGNMPIVGITSTDANGKCGPIYSFKLSACPRYTGSD